MNTKAIGDCTEAVVLAALIQRGDVVSIPFGDNQRYDLVAERDGVFSRIQCKTGRLSPDGAYVTFATSNSQWHRGKSGKSDYRGQADFFGVYCPQLEKVYLVPVTDVGCSSARLRLEATRNGQAAKVRMATDYEI